ncbi:MAG: nucleotidyl transferase AbiEii/AbiGii toxin family protein [Bacteroidaceae bacterium]|nr:nucleotidyl transferase AbiEii/AbiGii toxin family protein [Bacteroidaceae bacterium]
MHSGLTDRLNEIIDSVSRLECIKPYVLCGGTSLALQLQHRKSEDLDFMQWRTSKTEKPEVAWHAIQDELQRVVGTVENVEIPGFDQVLFWCKGAKLSFYVSDKYSPITSARPFIGNISIADMDAIMAMKIEVMMRRGKFRDYYDIYSMLKAGCSIRRGMEAAGRYSGHRLSTKNMIALLISAQVSPDPNFNLMSPIYEVSLDDIRREIKEHLVAEGII